MPWRSGISEMGEFIGKIVSRWGESILLRVGLGVALLVLVLDQISKWFVLERLQLSPTGCLEFQLASTAERASLINTCQHIELSSFFDVTMVWNKGVSFGLLGADGVVGRFLLVGFSVLVASVLIAGLLGFGPLRAASRWQAIAFGLFIGGALGNAVDRALYGAVVDFLNFSGLMFPWVFNVADVSINLGVAFIVLDLLIEHRKSTPSAK
jgi:signal peptidase II